MVIVVWELWRRAGLAEQPSPFALMFVFSV
jgi:hypothetical protein